MNKWKNTVIVPVRKVVSHRAVSKQMDKECIAGRGVCLFKTSVHDRPGNDEKNARSTLTARFGKRARAQTQKTILGANVGFEILCLMSYSKVII